MSDPYRYALSVTSQFYYCGLPLRLDAYSACTFSCAYCFAGARGGNRGPSTLRALDVDALARRLDQCATGRSRSVVDEYLVRRQPIHFGGMSDPFQPGEARDQVTLRVLKHLADHRYPTIVSTKGDLFTREDYLSVLKRGRFVVQLSLTTLDDSLAKRVEVGTPGPTRLLNAIRLLRREGVTTTVRLQPILPGKESHAEDVIEGCATAGVAHVAAEHLKLSVEKNSGVAERLGQVLGLDVRRYFLQKRARRVGREWVLPISQRIDRILRLRKLVRTKGMTYGAADNELLLLSDGACCCSGASFVSGFENYSQYTYVEAIRRHSKDGLISIDSVSNAWRPRKSIAQYVNSFSRIPSVSNEGANVEQYLKKNWNGSLHGPSPQGFWGVEDSGKTDDSGFRIYQLSAEAMRLLPSDATRSNRMGEL